MNRLSMLSVVVYLLVEFGQSDVCVPLGICLGSSLLTSHQYECVGGILRTSEYDVSDCSGDPVYSYNMSGNACSTGSQCNTYVRFRSYFVQDNYDDDLGIDFDSPLPLQCGETKEGKLAAGDHIVYEFTPSGNVEFDGCTGDLDLDTKFFIYKATDTQTILLRNDDSDCGVASYLRLSEDTDYDGTYYFVVTGYSLFEFGTYRFTYNCDVATAATTTTAGPDTDYYDYGDFNDPDPTDQCDVYGYYEELRPLSCVNYGASSQRVACSAESMLVYIYTAPDCPGGAAEIVTLEEGCISNYGWYTAIENIECVVNGVVQTPAPTTTPAPTVAGMSSGGNGYACNIGCILAMVMTAVCFMLAQ